MSYRLDLELPASQAVRAVARERVEHALRALREIAPQDPETAIHDVRKDAKKLRALLRLLQPSIDRDVRRGENGAIRSIAGGLSGSRDADVLAGLAADLHERAAGRTLEPAFAAVHDVLETRARAGRRERGEEVFATAITHLEALAERIEHWPLDDVRRRTLIDGLERSYRRGRKDLRDVRRHRGDAARLHEWRKRVKDLWYQERLLRDAWPGVLKAQAAELDELGELLGDDHDLAVLRGRLTEPGGVGTGIGEDLEPVVDSIDRRRDRLQGRALAVGARVYAERPGAFARRHRAYLRAPEAPT